MNAREERGRQTGRKYWEGSEGKQAELWKDYMPWLQYDNLAIEYNIGLLKTKGNGRIPLIARDAIVAKENLKSENRMKKAESRLMTFTPRHRSPNRMDSQGDEVGEGRRHLFAKVE